MFSSLFSNMGLITIRALDLFAWNKVRNTSRLYRQFKNLHLKDSDAPTQKLIKAIFIFYFYFQHRQKVVFNFIWNCIIFWRERRFKILKFYKIINDFMKPFSWENLYKSILLFFFSKLKCTRLKFLCTDSRGG